MPKSKIERTRTGCLTCRIRRIKCDEGRPDCNRCIKAGRECSRGYKVGFRHGQNPAREDFNADSSAYGKSTHRFGPDQEWLAVPTHLNFVDETTAVVSEYELLPSDTEMLQARQNLPNFEWIASALATDLLSSPTQSAPQLPISGSPREELGNILDGLSVEYSTSSLSDHLQPDDTSPSVVVSTPSEATIPLGVNGTFSEMKEAYLLRHYSETIAPCLDVTDPQRHFSIDVCQRARSSPVLLSACMALAAQHLSRTTSYDAIEAQRYHERSINFLIPLLNDDSAVNDDNMLAATVLLRFFEQMTCSTGAYDQEQHLAGCSAFVNAQRNCASSGGLRQAAFWVFVRQDMYMALYNQRPLMFNLREWEVEISFGYTASDENTWANWMVWIAAEVVDFCFGKHDDRWDRWEMLSRKSQKWFECKPMSFAPLFYKDRAPEDGKHLPDLMFACPWHITALQYYCLAKILLAVLNPARPVMGLSLQRFQRELANEVLEYSRALLATCVSNNNFLPARLTVCCAVVAFGPFLEKRAEQDILIDILRKTEADIAWPTAAVVDTLIDEWRWL